jgi:long-subunit fatty acid transport protein
MKKFILLFLIAAPLLLSQTKVGSTAAPFLNIGVGPRAIGMGGAFVATANDVTALYWNPAGASRVETSEAMFTHLSWFAGIKYNWAGAMLYTEGVGTIGLNIGYLDYGDLEVTTLREPEGTGEFFTPHDLFIALSYAYNLTDRFSIGGSVKYINQKIWNTSANGFSADLGVLFLTDIYGLRIGATITNFGTDMQLDGKDLLIQHDVNHQIEGNNDQIMATLNTDKFPLPLTFRVGLALDPIDIENHKFTIAVDASHPNDNAESLNAGIEYIFYNSISLRAGYKSLFLDNSEEGLNVGFGLRYDFTPTLAVTVDYAYQDFGLFDYTQQFAFGIRF